MRSQPGRPGFRETQRSPRFSWRIEISDLDDGLRDLNLVVLLLLVQSLFGFFGLIADGRIVIAASASGRRMVGGRGRVRVADRSRFFEKKSPMGESRSSRRSHRTVDGRW
jgi:hypothetical protein